jgi:hypothetical protein
MVLLKVLADRGKFFIYLYAKPNRVPYGYKNPGKSKTHRHTVCFPPKKM